MCGLQILDCSVATSSAANNFTLITLIRAKSVQWRGKKYWTLHVLLIFQLQFLLKYSHPQTTCSLLHLPFYHNNTLRIHPGYTCFNDTSAKAKTGPPPFSNKKDILKCVLSCIGVQHTKLIFVVELIKSDTN